MITKIKNFFKVEKPIENENNQLKKTIDELIVERDVLILKNLSLTAKAAKYNSKYLSYYHKFYYLNKVNSKTFSEDTTPKNLEVVELVKVNKAIIKNVNIRKRNAFVDINQTKLFLPTNKNKDTIFIDKAIKKHGNKYSYLKVNYTNAHTNVTITCSEHGNFQQRATNHLMGQGCPKCAKIASKIKKETIRAQTKHNFF